MSDYNSDNYEEQGGKNWVVRDKLTFNDSGYIDDTGKWDDLRVPMTAQGRAGLNDPDWIKLSTDGAGSQGVYTYGFDHAAEEELFFAVQIPHDAIKTADISPHVHWTPATSTAVGQVRWGLEYVLTEIGSTMTATTIDYVNDTAGALHTHELAEFTGIDMSTITSVSAMFMCRLFRDASDTADTYTGDAGLFEFDFHYKRGRLGSYNEYGPD